MVILPSRRQLGREIKESLMACSPSTIEMLHQLVQPIVSKKRLRKALGILRRDGIVDMLLGGHQTFYYQLSQSLPVREKLSREMNCHADDFIQPLLRRQDWFHNQWSQAWEQIIKRSFPKAEIVREHNIGASDIAKEVLLAEGNDLDLLPDFLVMFPKTESTQAVSLAFEIERTRKSEKRLVRKFTKYLNETRIDGLVYICDSSRLSETIRILYQTKLLANSPRLKHYGNHFLLLSDTLSAGAEPLERFFNSNGEKVSFQNWCRQLLNTKPTLRRDAQFT